MRKRVRRIMRFGGHYLSSARAWNQTSPVKVGRLQLIRQFPRWYHCLQIDGNALTLQKPWIPFVATDWLARNLQRDWRVFEWGIGGSTLFLVSKVETVVSIEHQHIWYETAREAVLSRHASNWKGFLIEAEPGSQQECADPSDWNGAASSDPSSKGYSFRKYVETIDRYPDSSFDLILIDGRSRPACFKHALPKLKIGGVILWDDTDRLSYKKALANTPKSFKIKHLAGPCPHLKSFFQASLIQRMA
jgi:hypothetical protein